MVYYLAGQIWPAGAQFVPAPSKEEKALQDGQLLALMKCLAPEQVEQIGRHAQVLTGIDNMQPVGRRALAGRLRLPEREVRTIAANLKDQGLLTLDAAGMQLTPKADQVLPGARDLTRSLFGLHDLEDRLSRALNIPYVLVVAGDAEKDAQVLREVGRACAHRLRSLLSGQKTVAIAGGSTMMETARGMQFASLPEVTVVPARGGMGNSIETQANTIASELARRLGGRCKAIHVPDSLDASALGEMLRLPEVKEAIELLEKADVVVHGIALADDMALRRSLPPSIVQRIRENGAVGETFGDFFDRNGQTVYRMNTVGTGLGHNTNCRLIAAAAGAGKAPAIIAALRRESHDSLITDESAAQEILALL